MNVEVWISKVTASHVSFMAQIGERKFGRFKWRLDEFIAVRENYIPNHVSSGDQPPPTCELQLA